MQRSHEPILFILLGAALGVIFASLFFLRAPKVALLDLQIRERDRQVALYGPEALSLRETRQALANKAAAEFDRAYVEFLLVQAHVRVQLADLAASRAGSGAVREEAERMKSEAEAEMLRLRALSETLSL